MTFKRQGSRFSINGSEFIECEIVDEVDANITRARMLLAEMGWTDPAYVQRSNVKYGFGITDSVPQAVAWQTFAVMGIVEGCWSCWSAWTRIRDTFVGECELRDLKACQRGSCPHPERPKVPPRELLTSPKCVTGGVSHGGEAPMTKTINFVEN